MTDSSKVKRTFFRTSKAWFHEAMRENTNILVGIDQENGGFYSEFEIEWIELNDRFVPRLKIYDDAWKIFPLIQDLLDKLGEVDYKCISEEDFAKMLIELGFVDITDYEIPNKYKTYTFLERYESYLKDKKVECKEQKILFEILKDLTGRESLGQVWEAIDEDIQNEILEKWYNIITKTK